MGGCTQEPADFRVLTTRRSQVIGFEVLDITLSHPMSWSLKFLEVIDHGLSREGRMLPVERRPVADRGPWEG